MKLRLSSNPKPVKIRIASGASEHDSLASLRDDFKVNDLALMLDDGRLHRWLEAHGESVLAKRIAGMTSDGLKDMDGIVDLCCAFFPNVSEEDGLLGLMNYWWQHGFQRNVSNMLSQDSSILQDVYPTLLNENGIEDPALRKLVVRHYFKTHSAEALETSDAPDEAKKLYSILSILNGLSIKKYREEGVDYAKMRTWFEEIWKSKEMTIKYPAVSSTNEYELAWFIDCCHQIKREHNICRTKEVCKKCFSELKQGDEFYNEAQFVLILLEIFEYELKDTFSYRNRKWSPPKQFCSRLQELGDYQPAIALLNPDSNSDLLRRFVFNSRINNETMIHNVIDYYFEEHEK